ncbi:MAG: AraC family transcriptional regulator [Opitutaceae bacterium]
MEERQNLIRELIPNEAGNTFVYKQERSIWPAWHYHEEIDVLLFIQSSGQHITGDCIGEFQPGTLLLNGSNVPHCFTSSDESITKSSEPAIAVLQFSIKSIGQELLSKAEMIQIREFLESTSRSFEYFGNTRAKAASIILEMHRSKGMVRFGQFLQLLETFASAPDCDKRMLVSEYYAPVLNDENVNRIELVRRWVQNNLHQKISLEAAASQIHMPAKAFSYFFKKNTGKAFVQYIKELRVGLASQQLLQTELSVLEICYACGYNNLSNFNRQFKDVKQTTPTAYRKEFKDITKQRHQSLLT